MRARLLASVLPACALAALSALGALGALGTSAGAGCSATSEPVGNGACDGFCTKAVNLHCNLGTTLDLCVAACVYEQSRCPMTMSEVIRCATNEGALACDPTTSLAHVVDCDPALRARDACLYAPDAGAIDGPLLPSGM